MNAFRGARAAQLLAEINDHWRFLIAAMVEEFKTAPAPDKDPQVEATKHARGLPAAAELKLGKVLAVGANVTPAAYRERARWLHAEAVKLPAKQAAWMVETAARFAELAELAELKGG